MKGSKEKENFENQCESLKAKNKEAENAECPEAKSLKDDAYNQKLIPTYKSFSLKRMM